MNYKIKNITVIIVIIFITVFSTSCDTNITKTPVEEPDTCFEEDKPPYDGELIGDNEIASSFFKKELDMKSLDDHKFYYDSGTYHFVLKFYKSVESYEIDNFMTYFSNIFISKSPASAIGITPYQKELQENIFKSTDKPFENLSLRVYIDNTKTFRHDYKFEDLKFISSDYWENTSPEYYFKYMTNEPVQNFIENNETSQNLITVRKTFKNDGVILIEINSNNSFEDEYIEKIRSDIEENLAPALEEESLEIYLANYQYLGIVLQFKVTDNITDEYLYYNGKDDDKGWIEEDWMQYKFLSNYLNS